MRKISLILPILLLTACTQYHGPAGDYNTFGRSVMEECNQIVWPDGQGAGKEAIGFGCKRYESSGISGEAAGIIEALVSQIPGLPSLIKWFNGAK